MKKMFQSTLKEISGGKAKDQVIMSGEGDMAQALDVFMRLNSNPELEEKILKMLLRSRRVTSGNENTVIFTLKVSGDKVSYQSVLRSENAA